MRGFHRIVMAWVGVGLMVGLIPGCPPQSTVPDFAAWPVDAGGYAIEVLAFEITSSFARGSDVYLGSPQGYILHVADDDLTGPLVQIPLPVPQARILLVTRDGVLLAGDSAGSVYRSADGGASWQESLAVPVWRMEEDDQGNLYTGNYTKDRRQDATLYKSVDSGVTWDRIWHDPGNDHIHTVRWDERAGRLYFAFGDGPQRGQGYTDDRGKTFTILARGSREGNTDVACGRDYVFWASDDQSGRIFRVDRQSGRSETLTGYSQFMWFAVAGDRQVYVGTMTSQYKGGERAALLASADQGETWQKLLETDVSSGPYDQGFNAESRCLSANGWLYCSNLRGPAYRIRREIPLGR